MSELKGLDIISLTRAHIARGGKIITPSMNLFAIGSIIQWDYVDGRTPDSIAMKIIAKSTNDEYQKEFKACFGKFSTMAFPHYYHIEPLR